MAATPPDAAAGGLVSELTALLAAKLAYWRARLELAGLEGKEALLNLALTAALVGAALVLLVFGYLLLLLALVFFIAWQFGGGNAWIWVTLGAGVLHCLIAGGLVWWARTRITRPMFAATMDELRKDQEWLTPRARPN